MLKKLIFSGLILSSALCAKTDFSTVPKQDKISLTIYNTQPIAFVKDSRKLTLREGSNKLLFSWENSFIDPTSINIKSKDGMSISELAFPANTRQLGIWTLNADKTGAKNVDITYFHSGFNWGATWQATLNPAGTHINLEGYMKISNFSGHDYENASIRTVAGKLNMKENINVLARRQYPYNTALQLINSPRISSHKRRERDVDALEDVSDSLQKEMLTGSMRKAVSRTKVSEYIMFSLPGEITLRDKWEKSVGFVNTKKIPVTNIYRYGWTGQAVRHNPNQCYRFLTFKNDKESHFKGGGLPTGAFYLYRQIGKNHQLGFEGRSSMKYIPENKEAEIFLGSDSEVSLIERITSVSRSDIRFNSNGTISGYIEQSTRTYTAQNLRSVAITLEIYRTVNRHVSIIDSKNAKFKNESTSEIKAIITLKPGEKREIALTLKENHGTLRK